MRHIGDFRIDDYVILGEQLHRFSSGAVYAPTGDFNYTIYENNTVNGPGGTTASAATLSQLNSKTGLYSARIQLTGAAGYETGKDYIVHYEATVDSVAAGFAEWFRVISAPAVDVTRVAGATVSTTASQFGVNVVRISDATVSSTAAQIGTNIVQISGTTVSTTTAQLGVNSVQVGGTAQTGLDLGANIGPAGAGLTALAPAATALSSATWTNTMAGYLDAAITSRAPAATALSSATWSSTIAGYIDAAITSRAPAVTALSSATWTNTMAGYLDGPISGRAPAATALSSATWTNTMATYLDVAVSSRSTLSATNVNAEVVDALRTDTGTELASVPAANASMAAQTQFIYQKIRNAETHSTTQCTVANSAGAVIGTAAASDDGTTYTKGKYA